MDYIDWLATLTTKRYTNKEYYGYMVQYRREIIEDVEEHNQSIVASKLNMTQPTLGNILRILRVLK